jgi:uncharacterized protein (PEP-CTERM system associated)
VVQDTGLRDQMERYFAGTTPPAPADGQPAWTFTPSIGLEQGWTNNATQIGTGKPSAITTIRPGLLINGESQRLKGTVNLQPDGTIYEGQNSQSQIGLNGSADLLVTVVPEAFFVDIRGMASQYPAGGGYAPSSVGTLSRSNSIQTFSGAVAPYLQHRFGELGIGEIGGSVGHTVQLGYGGYNVSAVPGQSANEDLTTYNEHAVFKTGSAFGRSSGQFSATGAQFDGTGALSGAYAYNVGIQYGYGVTRQLMPLGEIGWEDIYYSGVSPFRANNMTWAAGAKWTPSPESEFFLTYGRHFGRYGFTGNASMALSARSRLYGSYSQQVTSNTQTLQSTLALAQIDPFGNPVNPVTGAPVLVGQNLYGSVGGGAVYYATMASVGYALLLERDVINLSVNQSKQQGLTGETLAAANAQTNAVFGAINWTHNFTADTALSAYFQYGANNNNTFASNQHTRPIVGSATLHHALSDKLNVYIRYTYSNGAQINYVSQATQNVSLVAVGLLKTF